MLLLMPPLLLIYPIDAFAAIAHLAVSLAFTLLGAELGRMPHLPTSPALATEVTLAFTIALRGFGQNLAECPG